MRTEEKGPWTALRSPQSPASQDEDGNGVIVMRTELFQSSTLVHSCVVIKKPFLFFSLSELITEFVFYALGLCICFLNVNSGSEVQSNDLG